MRYSLADVPQIAADLLTTHGRARTYALVGDLGAGKTTLIAEMCRQLGVTEPTSSPTFSIVNQYRSANGPVYHLDCYRLQSLEEAIGAGLEELLTGAEDRPVFVEWPLVIAELLPEDMVVLRLAHGAEGDKRSLEVRS